MALITDPDNLSQGTSTTVGDLAFTSSSGASTTLTGAATLPAIAANEYFEIRDSSTAGNNGLYRASGTPTTSSITCSKVDGPNPTNLTAESTRIIGRTSGLKSIHVDTEQKRIYLLEQGNLSTDGVTEQALYSFLKEEWKADADLIRYAFPITAITPEQFEYANGWEPRDVVSPAIQSKKLIRTGGWSELNTAGVMERQYVGVITLGSFEDNLNDTAYYQLGADPTDLASTNNFTFNGPVNEAILTYDNIGTPAGLNFQTTNSFIRSSGSFITDGFRKGADVTIVGSGANDGTYLLTNVAALYMNVSSASFVTGASSNALMAVDNRRAIKLFLRIRDLDTNGKTYSSSDLTAIGASSGVDNKVFRFPLSNATDLDISETDANIAANEPYTEVRLRYLPAAYNRDVDSSTDRNFGIIVDVGTFSHSQGASHSNSTFTWTSGAGSVPLGAGEALSDYTNGTLIIHEGSDQGTKTISGTPTDSSGTLQIPLSAGLTSTATNLSFTMQRATPIVASKTEIYEKIQYLLRQSGDIDSLGSVVSGKTADGLATFVGPDLRMGALSPANPNGGGSGVIIEGFSSNDTNNLFFFDNTGTSRNYPFVAAGTINFNPNLQNDTDSKYWMFFRYTSRTTRTDVAVTSASGSTATLTSSGAGFPTLVAGDFVAIAGFSNAVNNGIWRITTYTSASSMAAYRVSGETVVNESAGASITIDQNPIDSPDAIIVNDNSGSPITGDISAQASVGFDFDYDNNSQGGRTVGTDAAVVIRAIGFSTAQFVETTGTITRNTGLSFSLVSALERNYSNL